MATICEKLRIMREEAGLEQGQIAEYLGVTQSFISEVEAGERNLTVDQLESVANLCGYSLASFSDKDLDPRPIHFAFQAQSMSRDDLRTIAEINRIASNIRFMANVLGASAV